jgi:transcriptional regulator with XRE-family HTH domain
MANFDKINPKEFTQQVLNKIKQERKLKGYSIEYMADQLNMSVSGYGKIEKSAIKLSLEKIIEIQQILQISLIDLFELKADNVYTQTLHDNAVGYQQIEHLYQENKEVIAKLINAYKDEVSFLRSKLTI